MRKQRDLDRVFLHFLNPELRTLFGIAANADEYRHILRTTRYAVLGCTGSLVIPASYLFEVRHMRRLLRDIRSVVEAGLIEYASPSADLEGYAEKKRKEYRDSPTLFDSYESTTDSSGTGLIWAPRIARSASGDISDRWTAELSDGGLWSRFLGDKTLGIGRGASLIESAIALVPERLEGRAFIMAHAERFIPLTLDDAQKTQVNMMINRAYLESYLLEYGARILVEGPLGSLDCGLLQDKPERTVSMRAMQRLFNWLGITGMIENELSWIDAISLRDDPLFARLVRISTSDQRAGISHLANAIRESQYVTPSRATRHNIPEAAEAIRERVYQFFNRAGSYLPPEPREETDSPPDERATVVIAPRPWVISVHGIRTRGEWQKTLNPALNEADLNHVPLDYGFWRAVKLVAPWLRKRQVEWFRDEYERIRTRHQAGRPSVVAHSFGTYIVTKAIELYNLEIDRLILCGSIVRTDYPWREVADRGLARAVLNDIGRRDLVVTLAPWIIPDAGPSGNRGFTNPPPALVQQVVHTDFGHSDVFYARNYETRWIPFLRGGTPAEVVAAPERRFPWRSWLLAGLVLLAGTLLASRFLWRFWLARRR
jgi:pimeloyl-ACP methyl ester carboxylesterase